MQFGRPDVQECLAGVIEHQEKRKFRLNPSTE